MKPCTILLVQRDVDGVANGETSFETTTADDGATVVIPIGYLPGLATALPGDITVRVAAINETAPVSASVVVDYETEQQTVTFAY